MTAHPTTDPTRWPEQVRLPGQSSVADGPHDQTGMYLMHHAFRRDLAAFETAVRRTPIHDVATWRALAARWDRFAVVLHHHHTIEDTSIWPVMLDAVEDPADRETLEAMEAEHDLVDPALDACTAAFAAMAEAPAEDRRNALDVRVTTVRALLVDHLAHEETGALPVLQRTLTEDQFAATEKAAGDGYPPSLVPFLVPWVMEGVPDEVARVFLRKAGRVYGVLLTLTRPWFRRAERRAFGHV